MRNIITNNWRKFFAFALVLNLGLTSCSLNEEDFKPCITGKGEVVTEQHEVAEFTGIDLKINGTVYLTEGSETKVEINAYETLQPFILTKVSGNTLVIDTDRCFRSEGNIKIYVTVPNIEQVTVTGSGKVVSQGIFGADNLSLKVAGSGTIEVDADAENIKSEVAGSGNIYVAGRAYNQEAIVAGSGNLQSYQLLTDDASVAISGSGKAYVQAAQKLNVIITGSGDVQYRGQPTVKTDISGSGKVSPVL